MTAEALYFFEDFVPGRVWEVPGPTLTRDEIIDFGRKFDPQAFHIDEEKAKQSIYGGLIASGWHTVGLCMRMICDGFLLASASLGSPGIDQLRWTRPVRPGDTLRLRVTVREAIPSRSRPDRGIAVNLCEVFNQHGELVMTMEGRSLLACRGSEAAA